MVSARPGANSIDEMYPTPTQPDLEIPAIARDYLGQAMRSLHAPSGAVMLAASAVDSMLKAKGYKKGSLNDRIDAAAKDHLITEEMSKWAHQVRLEANEQRHADEAVSLPSDQDAARCLDFASALGKFLFTFPSRVEKGLKESAKAS